MEVLCVGEVMEWYGWLGKMETGLVMALGQRNKVEKECMKLVGGWENGINERSRR